MGCKNVKLIGYSSDMTYSEFYKDKRPVDQIKHRHVKKYSKKKTDDNTWLVVLVVVFIILLIILGLLGYKYYKQY